MTNLFTKQENTQAYLKCGILGFAGSGKTTTATNIAAGLTLYTIKKGITDNNKIFFLDTETGSDFVEHKFKEHNLELLKAKTRAFKDLLSAIKEAEKSANVLIIDSITHFWIELMDAYKKEKRRRFISFQDWGNLKNEWRKFTDLYINSNLHIIVCGRAGFEYDHIEDDDGKVELSKSGIKMKAENETGYEASLLIYMNRRQEMKGDDVVRQWREAQIWKDRTDTIDGSIITNPRFKDFLPHIERLNLGGEQVGVDTKRNSEEMFESEKTSYTKYNHSKKILIEEMENKLAISFSSSKADKENKFAILNQVFGMTSWTAITDLSYETLQKKQSMLYDLLDNPKEIEAKKEEVKKVEKIEKVAATTKKEPKNDDEIDPFGAQLEHLKHKETLK